jgi:hypothetical protein
MVAIPEVRRLMMVTMIKYLGEHVSMLLASSPFKYWRFERLTEDDLPEIRVDYEFDDNGLSIICDSDDRIRSIFIDVDIFDQKLVEIPFSSSRSEVLDMLGKPAKVGAARKDAILGEYGPWDRFDEAGYSIHVEYQPHADRIRKITLMRADVVP